MRESDLRIAITAASYIPESARSRVCLVTSAQVAYNPRLVKEADALSHAGYSVRVVAPVLNAERWVLDRELVSVRLWTADWLDVSRASGSSSARWLVSALRQRLFGQIAGIVRRENVLTDAYSRYWRHLARLAAREPADLYIAHNLAALPAAAWAAKRHGARLGFDAEDFHRGELAPTAENQAEIRLTSAIEEHFIPCCDYVTAASDGIAEAYAETLGIERPVTILNTFPLAERSGRTSSEELARERRGPGLSLYWYSQTIGHGRGLEDALVAMARLGPGARLHLRGTWAAGYETHFMARARALGVAESVHHLPPAPPNQLIERAAQHDVGLALEPGDRPNNNLAVSNKILAYLTAGLAVAATRTRGQEGVMAQAAGAGFLYSAGDVCVLATGLREWLDSPTRLEAARCAAAKAAAVRFDRERDRVQLIELVDRVLAAKRLSWMAPRPPVGDGTHPAAHPLHKGADAVDGSGQP